MLTAFCLKRPNCKALDRKRCYSVCIFQKHNNAKSKPCKESKLQSEEVTPSEHAHDQFWKSLTKDC